MKEREIQSLMDRMERLRAELNLLYDSDSEASEKILSISQELDDLIKKFYYLRAEGIFPKVKG
jgi:hypothetical protein